MTAARGAARQSLTGAGRKKAGRDAVLLPTLSVSRGNRGPCNGARSLEKFHVAFPDVAADFCGAEVVAWVDRQSNFMFDKEADGKRRHDAARANRALSLTS